MLEQKHKSQKQSLLQATFKTIACFLSSVMAEEARFHSNAIVTTLWADWDPTSSSPSALLYGSFKANIALDNSVGTMGDYSKGFKFDFGASYKVSLAFIVNVVEGYDYIHMRIGGSKICIGNDGNSPTATSNTCLPYIIVEGGFKDIQLLEGRYLYLYRVGDSISADGIYNLGHLSLYQTPNLVNFSTKFITYCIPIAGYEVDNLKTNMTN